MFLTLTRSVSEGLKTVQTLSEELAKRKFTVKARATLGVKGTYSLAELPAENRDDARRAGKRRPLPARRDRHARDSYLIDVGGSIGGLAASPRVRGLWPGESVVTCRERSRSSPRAASRTSPRPRPATPGHSRRSGDGALPIGKDILRSN